MFLACSVALSVRWFHFFRDHLWSLVRWERKQKIITDKWTGQKASKQTSMRWYITKTLLFTRSFWFFDLCVCGGFIIFFFCSTMTRIFSSYWLCFYACFFFAEWLWVHSCPLATSLCLQLSGGSFVHSGWKESLWCLMRKLCERFAKLLAPLSFNQTHKKNSGEK